MVPRSWVCVAGVALLAWSLAPQAGAAPGKAAPARSVADAAQQPATWIRAVPQRHQLRHRGDWERTDALVVVQHWEWARPIARLARMAARWAKVLVLVPGDETDPPRFGGRRSGIRVMHQGTDTPWIRDYGPLQVFDRGHPRWLDFAYADDRQRDDRVPRALATHFEMPLEVEHQRFDGGAIASNGRGLCAVTDRSLDEAGFVPGDRRLPSFASRLGCWVMAILPALPDESTGHVDLFVQFFGPNLVGVGQMHESWRPEHAAALETSTQILVRAAAAMGQPLQVIRIPIVAGWGDTFYSYVNGITVGDAFFMPTYSTVGHATQALALRRLRAAARPRKIVQIRADEMIQYGGALHCITDGLSLRSAEDIYARARWAKLDLASWARKPLR